jgi:SPP1 family predicted phage head-tail adaptor
MASTTGGIAAGRLRHRVTIEQQVNVVNSFGEHSKEWEPFAQVWAAVEPLSARELLAAQQVQSQVVARVIMRYNAAVTASMRIVYRGVVYNIAGVQRDPESGLEWMTLPVSYGLNQG